MSIQQDKVQALGEALGQGKAQIGAALLDAGEALAEHGGLQSAADGFDLGKFRHGIGSSACVERARDKARRFRYSSPHPNTRAAQP